MNKFSIPLLLLLSIHVMGQSVPKRNWVYTILTQNPTIITNSLPKGGGVVPHQGKKYDYFIFWTSIRNTARSPVDFFIQFPERTFFKANKSHFKVAFTTAKMTYAKVQDFDYGLSDIPALLNKESNQLQRLEARVLPQNEYVFYMPVFIHQTKWPVRAALSQKGNKLFYQIIAGTDTVMVPCGEIKYKQ